MMEVISRNIDRPKGASTLIKRLYSAYLRGGPHDGERYSHEAFPPDHRPINAMTIFKVLADLDGFGFSPYRLKEGQKADFYYDFEEVKDG